MCFVVLSITLKGYVEVTNFATGEFADMRRSSRGGLGNHMNSSYHTMKFVWI